MDFNYYQQLAQLTDRVPSKSVGASGIDLMVPFLVWPAKQESFLANIKSVCETAIRI